MHYEALKIANPREINAFQANQVSILRSADTFVLNKFCFKTLFPNERRTAVVYIILRNVSYTDPVAVCIASISRKSPMGAYNDRINGQQFGNLHTISLITFILNVALQ